MSLYREFVRAHLRNRASTLETGFMLFLVIVVGLTLYALMADKDDSPKQATVAIPAPVKVGCELLQEVTSVVVKDAASGEVIAVIADPGQDGVQLSFDYEGQQPDLYWIETQGEAEQAGLYAALVTRDGCQVYRVPEG